VHGAWSFFLGLKKHPLFFFVLDFCLVFFVWFFFIRPFFIRPFLLDLFLSVLFLLDITSYDGEFHNLSAVSSIMSDHKTNASSGAGGHKRALYHEYIQNKSASSPNWGFCMVGS
jgi:hypothetical protein